MSELVSDGQPGLRLRVATALGTIVFIALLCLFVITAIPYGTVEAWWRAFFVCTILGLTIVWLVEGYLSGSWIKDGWALILPMTALVIFSFLQSISLGQTVASAGGAPSWNAFSSDPYQTRFFSLQLLAITLAAVLMFRYVATEKRMRLVINLIILIAVASAIFGVIRQTTQHQLGFGLPLLKVDSGYGQFINRNHFAYLMEMAFGLTVGMLIAGGSKREHLLVYVAALFPIWTALVLCGSRGGLIAMIAQVITAALMFNIVVRDRSELEQTSKVMRIARALPVRIALILVLVGGVTIGTLWLGGDPLAARIESSHAEFSSDTDESRQNVRRNEIWKTTLNMFAAHPILGVGLGAYWVAVPAFHNASGVLTPQQAHNDYLELLASGGLVAVAIFLWFAVVVIRRTKASLRSVDRFRRAAAFGAVIGIVGVAIHSLMDFGLHMIVNAFVFTTLLVIATSKPGWASRSPREIG